MGNKQNIYFQRLRETVFGETGLEVVRGVFGVETVRQSDCSELELIFDRFRFLLI